MARISVLTILLGVVNGWLWTCGRLIRDALQYFSSSISSDHDVTRRARRIGHRKQTD